MKPARSPQNIIQTEENIHYWLHLIQLNETCMKLSEISFSESHKARHWNITHCLGLGHETMVCAVCLSIFLLSVRSERNAEGCVMCDDDILQKS